MKKKFFIHFMFFVLPFLMGASSVWEKIPVLKEEVDHQSKVCGVSVSPKNEVLVALNDGTMYVFSMNHEFLRGYKFPLGGVSYEITIDEYAKINHFTPRQDSLYVYNFSGELVEEKKISRRNMDVWNYYLDTNHRVDSNQAEYKIEKGNVVRVSRDGTKEIFYEGYYQPTSMFYPLVVLMAIFFVAYVRRKDISQALSHLKKQPMR